MGLAASQARFLAVTSRKANCEYRTTELAQQRLSYTRELDNVSKEYQDALNSTMFVWDADGSGDYRYQLSYDIMMSPSDYNQYVPYLVSRQDGKIAFEDNMMQAVAKVFNYDKDTGTTDGGIQYGGKVVYKGDADYEDAKEYAFSSFIDALKENRAIQGSVADKINYYLPDAGVGGELFSRTEYNAVTANGLCSYVDYIVDNTLSGYFPYDSSEYVLANKLIFDFEQDKYLYSTIERNLMGYADPAKNKVRDVGANLYNLSGTMSKGWRSTNGNTCLMINGSYASDPKYNVGDEKNNAGGYNNAEYSASAFTLADLLSEDVTLMVTGQMNYNPIFNLIESMLENFAESGSSLINDGLDVWYDNNIKISNKNKGNDNCYFESFEDLCAAAKKYNGASPEYHDPTKKEACKAASSTLALLNYFDKLVKSMWYLLMPDENVTEKATISDKDKEKLNAFYLAVKNLIKNMRNTIGSTTQADSNYDYVDKFSVKIDTESFAKHAVQEADNYNCWVKYGNEWALSLSNLTECFMTDFVNGMDSYQDGCLISKNSKTSTYITDYPDYQYIINMPNEAKTGLWESEFYSVIFNNICNQGAYTNENISDNKYLENALKNGQLFVMSKADDNRYYQSKYTDVSGGHFVVEKDYAAIERAEREYIYKKNQINYKEEQIELEMKQLDAELSELTTELESIKNLIKTSIDKTLKMFQS